jgi:hypothetical protein
VPPTTGILDDFDRANGALGADWSDWLSIAAQPVISSNQVADGGNEAAAYWDQAFFDRAREVYVDVVGLPDASSETVMIGLGRADGTEYDLIMFMLQDNGDGVDITIYGTGFDSHFAGGVGYIPTKMWIRHGGWSYNAYVYDGADWDLVYSRSHAMPSESGVIGMYIQNASSAVRFDNFGGGSVDPDPDPLIGAMMSRGPDHPAFLPIYAADDPFGVLG